MSAIANKCSRLIALADTLDADADRKHAPRVVNTPKRQREAGTARVEGDRARRAAGYLRAYAEALASGDLPPDALDWKATKVDALAIAAQHYGANRGYYDPPTETGEYHRTDPQAVALRELAERKQAPARTAAIAAAAHENDRQAALMSFRRSCGPGFFPTPTALAKELARILASCVTAPNPILLEPSAGTGSLIEAVNERIPSAFVHAFEIRPDCCEFINRWIPSTQVDNTDFLEVRPQRHYNGVIMNPPFERYQAPAHIAHALHFLVPGGTLVAVVPSGFLKGQGKNFAGLNAVETPNNPQAFNDRREALRTTATRTSTLVIRA